MRKVHFKLSKKVKCFFSNISILLSSGIPEVAKLGSLQYEETYESDEARPQLRAIVQIIPHPLYKPSERYNDIALYKLDRPVSFNYYVRQACLSPYPTNEGISRNMVQSVGWKDADWGEIEV